MASIANLCGLLLGVAVFAFWIASRSTRPLGRGMANVLGGLGIVALIFSAVSPDDDLFQKQWIRPENKSVNAARCIKVAPRRQFPAFSITALAVAADPVLVPRTGRSFMTDNSLHLELHSATTVLIHSPPNLRRPVLRILRALLR
jgi:hypothetical protein